MLSVTHRLNRGGYDELVTVCIDCVSDRPRPAPASQRSRRASPVAAVTMPPPRPASSARRHARCRAAERRVA